MGWQESQWTSAIPWGWNEIWGQTGTSGRCLENPQGLFTLCPKLGHAQLPFPCRKLQQIQPSRNISQPAFYQAFKWGLNVRKCKSRAQEHHCRAAVLSLPPCFSLSSSPSFTSLLSPSLFSPHFFLLFFQANLAFQNTWKFQINTHGKQVWALFSTRILGSIWFSHLVHKDNSVSSSVLLNSFHKGFYFSHHFQSKTDFHRGYKNPPQIPKQHTL